jgi:hypothetical protein
VIRALQSAGAMLVEFEADEIAHEPPVRSILGVLHARAECRSGLPLRTTSGSVGVGRIRTRDSLRECRRSSVRVRFGNPLANWLCCTTLATTGRRGGGPLPAGYQPRAPTDAESASWKRKNPTICRVNPKRLIGLEPTTFCMASSGGCPYFRSSRGFAARGIGADPSRLPGVLVTNW